MTEILDFCLGQKVTANQAFFQKPQIQNLFQYFPTSFQKFISPLDSNSFCISLSSEGVDGKIKYQAILKFNSKNIQLKIIPLDEHGLIIRSKENFNKNGWIRKHINEDKHNFLKLNPVTGQLHYKYSFFTSQITTDVFCKSIIETLQGLSKNLTKYLVKIINLQGKEKPMASYSQIIQTNKLVTTLKLAQIFRQNQKIQSQFKHVKTDKMFKKRIKFQLFQISQKKKYLVVTKQKTDYMAPQSLIKMIAENYIINRRSLEAQALLKNKSNIVGLTLSKADQQRLRVEVNRMKFGEEIIFKMKQLNKQVGIMVKKLQEEKVLKIRRVLNAISKEVQYGFLHTYFDQQIFEDAVMRQYTQRQIPLAEYLRRNNQTMSYLTKFILLIQALNSVATLWLKNNISFQNINIKSFTVTKSVRVKFNRLYEGIYVHPSKLQTGECLLFYNQRKQILKNFSDIYFHIFFKKSYLSHTLNSSYKQSRRRGDQNNRNAKQKLVFESLNEITKFYYPNNLFTLIIGLNYFFINQYWNSFKKVEEDYKMTDFLNREKRDQEFLGPQVSLLEDSIQLQETQKQLKEAKRGNVRIDLVLSMIIQYLEEHDNSNQGEQQTNQQNQL